MAILDIYSYVVAYGDGQSTTAPAMKYVDWNRKIQNIPVARPSSTAVTLAPGETRNLTDGPAWEGSGTYEIVGEGKGVYRLDSTDPSGYFRELYAAHEGGEVTLTVLPSGLVKLEGFVAGTGSSALPPVGSIFDIRGTEFSSVNRAQWGVVSIGEDYFLIERLSDKSVGRSETVDATKGSIVVYSRAGVQTGDQIFSPTHGFTVSVDKVSERSVWFSSPTRFPEGEFPGLFKAYRSAKKFFRLEANGKVFVTFNSTTPNRIVPLTLPEGDQLGWVEMSGVVFEVSVSSAEEYPVTLNIISVE